MRTRIFRYINFVISVALAGLAHAQTPQTAPLLQKADLTYLCAFRVPAGVDDSPYLAFRNGTLLVGGDMEVKAITIPACNAATTVGGLPTATLIGTVASLTQAQVNAVNPQGQNTRYLAGVLPLGSDLILTAVDGYDAGHTSAFSHFKVSGSTVSGPVKVGTTTPGFVAGYMATIPPEWVALLGGPAFTGQCCIPVISRTSLGPGISVFNPADVGTGTTVSARQVLGYSTSNPTLGACDSSGQLFNCNTEMGGLVFPAGTRTVFFVGRLGKGPTCYGNGTTDPALHGVMGPDGAIWCFDPVPAGKGPHSYPYVHHVWAYDANDLLAVKNGTKQPWQVVPYATWELTLPFPDPEGNRAISGVAHDPATNRVYVADYKANVSAPLIKVLQLNAAGSVTPPPVVVPPVVVPPPPVVTPPPVPVPQAGTISATPNPCTVSSGTTCASTITWNASQAADASVFVTLNGITQLFACGTSGSQAAPWIESPFPYAFALHAMACPASAPSGTPLASVTVTASGLTPVPPPTPPPTSVVYPTPAFKSTQTLMTWNIPTSPDGTSGWTLRLRRNGVNVGTTTSATVPCGQSGYTWRWSKSGQTSKDSAPFTAVCP